MNRKDGQKLEAGRKVMSKYERQGKQEAGSYAKGCPARTELTSSENTLDTVKTVSSRNNRLACKAAS
jgi:hypothetical protein